MDFQNSTAKHILNLFKSGQKRVLVADEVGLGKTFVARNVVSMVKEWHKNANDDFFVVVYICSNANIVEQNVRKLTPRSSGKISFSENRLSMQHLNFTLLKEEKKALSGDGMPEVVIPITPATSFRFASMQGTAGERALMCVIIEKFLSPGLREVLSKFLSCGVQNFDTLLDKYRERVGNVEDAQYLYNLKDKIQGCSIWGVLISLLECIKEINNGNIQDVSIDLDRFIKYVGKAAWESYKKLFNDRITSGYVLKKNVINSLRRIFATYSVEILEPDLVIIDEFQRFKYLLNSTISAQESEQDMLVKKFFSNENTKILLLSATPYKPFTTLEESNAGENNAHHEEFMNLVRFLMGNEKMQNFEKAWNCYSSLLRERDVTDITQLVAAKEEVETQLFSVMCRTERFNSGIINTDNVKEINITESDVHSYIEGELLLETLFGKHSTKRMPVEYVKSSPYLLSFMDSYKLKADIAAEWPPANPGTPCKHLLLSGKSIRERKKIAPSNAKLQYLHDMFFTQAKSHLLLWVPPSLSYYSVDVEPFKGSERFSKVILFSSWEMVPRMVSVMMSYYSDYYAGTKGERGESRLRDNAELLTYPCEALAACYTPASYFGFSLKDIRGQVKEKIKKRIEDNEYLKGIEPGGRKSEDIVKLMKILDGEILLEKESVTIPANAYDILTDIAIASPAVCAFRQSRDASDAEKVGKAFVSLFNKSEAAAVIDSVYIRGNKKRNKKKRKKIPYYSYLLDYCAQGNMQAMLDEYLHIAETEKLGDVIEESIIATANLRVDTDETIGTDKKQAMPVHFAVPFIDKSISDKSIDRTKRICRAFNSPFRPFLLSSTSIGQEGLDFHPYARKIVHWNLPSNPVDLEQREGRINRYKCLAVRRNVARLYAADIMKNNSGLDSNELWTNLFKKAKSELGVNHSDMVPYWCLPMAQIPEEKRKGFEYIERIVPLYPMSRDLYRYSRMIDMLSYYRITLGQPRQEELVEMLKNMGLSDDQLSSITINLSPIKNEEYKTVICYEE